MAFQSLEQIKDFADGWRDSDATINLSRNDAELVGLPVQIGAASIEVTGKALCAAVDKALGKGDKPKK